MRDRDIFQAALHKHDPADRAGIVAISCLTSEDVKRHLIERGIYTHGDDGRVCVAGNRAGATIELAAGLCRP